MLITKINPEKRQVDFSLIQAENLAFEQATLRLRKLLGFSTDELRLNRRGELSKRQLRALEEHTEAIRKLLVLTSTVFSLVFVILLGVFIVRQNTYLAIVSLFLETLVLPTLVLNWKSPLLVQVAEGSGSINKDYLTIHPRLSGKKELSTALPKVDEAILKEKLPNKRYHAFFITHKYTLFFGKKFILSIDAIQAPCIFDRELQLLKELNKFLECVLGHLGRHQWSNWQGFPADTCCVKRAHCSNCGAVKLRIQRG